MAEPKFIVWLSDPETKGEEIETGTAHKSSHRVPFHVQTHLVFVSNTTKPLISGLVPFALDIASRCNVVTCGSRKPCKLLLISSKTEKVSGALFSPIVT